MTEPETRTKLDPEPAIESLGYARRKKSDGLTILLFNHNRRASLARLLRGALDAGRHLEEAGIASEVLVFDVASRDGSQKLLRSVQMLYEDPCLEIVYFQERLDAPRLRNIGLETARFRYGCTLYAGDELAPENLPVVLESLRQTGAALAYGNLIEFHDGEVVGMRANTTIAPGFAKSSSVDGFSVADLDRLIDLGGYTSIHPDVTDDWEMLLHLDAEEELVLFVPVVLGYRNTSSASAGQGPGLSEKAAEALKQVYAPEGSRDWNSIQIGRIYHPEAGFVDEW